MKFLVVDDSSTMRRIVVNSLQRIGFTDTVEAGDGQEALDRFDPSVGFVITDWNMPNMTGTELARALRAAAEAHHQRVLAAVGRSRACPFDLHALLPVPDRILRLGPSHLASTAWLRRHWGTLQPLRHVRLRQDAPDRRLRRSARLRYEFWSADWTPWPALLALRARWPDVAFDLRPDYGGG